MDGLSKYDPLQGGYDFLALTDNGHTFHPGVDLNAGNGGDADLGNNCRAVIDGTIYGITKWGGSLTGYGNHLWIAFRDGSYGHYCHLDWMANVSVGEEVHSGDAIGACGKSGNQTWAHLHFEVRRDQPPYLDYWPYGVSKETVIHDYHRPLEWFRNLFFEQGDVSMLSQWQIVNWVLVDLYTESGLAFNPETAINKSWADEMKAGRYKGRPLSPEHQIEGGAWQEFQLGVAVWLGGTISWNG